LTINVTNIILVITVFLVSCNSAQQKDIVSIKQSANHRLDTLHNDTTILKEAFQQEDTAYNEYLTGRLKPIRENFKRINSISKWTSVAKQELNESTEGGEATFYYSNSILEKL
jgi:hypothetical protein